MINPLLVIQGIKLLKDLSSTGDDKKDKEIVVDALSSAQEKPFWMSKRWWVAIIGVAVPIINKATGLGLSPVEIGTAVTPLLIYIGGKSHEQKG